MGLTEQPSWPESEAAAAVWERLASTPFGGRDPEPEFVDALAWIHDRPKAERLTELDRLIFLADEEEKATLLAEKRELLKGGSGRYRSKALRSQREPRF